jgi:NitT/TauT family transport system permease protein
MSEQVRQEPAAASATPRSGAPLLMNRLGVTLLRAAIIGGFLLLWEIASGRWIEPFLISSPSRIFWSLIGDFRDGDLLQHTWVTFEEVAIGFPIGAITGIALGYAFGRSRVLAASTTAASLSLPLSCR